jgi:hypothetical protein
MFETFYGGRVACQAQKAAACDYQFSHMDQMGNEVS